MTIPSNLKLEQRQVDKLNRWLKFLQKQAKDKNLQKSYDARVEEDCAAMSSVSFSVRYGNIMDEIYAHDDVSNCKCSLSIDDDNELAKDEFPS